MANAAWEREGKCNCREIVSTTKVVSRSITRKVVDLIYLVANQFFDIGSVDVFLINHSNLNGLLMALKVKTTGSVGLS